MLNGADFIAVVRVSNLENETLAAPGETCERVKPESIGWLEEQGHIRRKPEPPAAAEKPKAVRRPASRQEGE